MEICSVLFSIQQLLEQLQSLSGGSADRVSFGEIPWGTRACLHRKNNDKALVPDTGCSTPSLSMYSPESSSFISVGCRSWNLVCDCLWTIRKSGLQGTYQCHYTLIVSAQLCSKTLEVKKRLLNISP